jgi:phosphatidylethanolamine-binding protein (PEBP) family uncharacterized protein
MAHITFVGCVDKGKSTETLTSTGLGEAGRLSCAAMVSLCCLLVNCNGGTKGATMSDGGPSTSAGGTTSTSGSASGGTNAAGGALSAVGGGSSTVTGAGGAGGTTGSTAGGGLALTGGAGGSKTGGTGAGAAIGGTTGSGGKSSSGGATEGGASGSGGRSSSGGATEGGAIGSGGSGGATSGTFTLTSPGWANMAGCGPDAKTSCPILPTEITRSGAGTSPELHWAGTPEGTKSFVVVLQDLNNGTAHWILWNILPTFTSLAANVDRTTATPAIPPGSQQCGKGTDAATSDGYYGPGAPCNVYELMIYALGISQFSPTSATDQESVRTQLKALGSSILGTASLRGRTNTGC